MLEVMSAKLMNGIVRCNYAFFNDGKPTRQKTVRVYSANNAGVSYRITLEKTQFGSPSRLPCGRHQDATNRVSEEQHC